ncbi:Hypothetical Protein FCC1311_013452 [Hondaea fermentalgiana]|uniref:Uncharacterized protein n=1 Tax=Hondaea fermentalgiana TaxID=2315210 RepID=A0A2R5G5S7_9STRA|nr:Hypothetical Protein FCC1311_013452 [Hondaea fermentalgiana]|eukprot:GBG25128.1 Hypothetical Protein FCC1311_013452 [Hondaea fermentalgiana]
MQAALHLAGASSCSFSAGGSGGGGGSAGPVPGIKLAVALAMALAVGSAVQSAQQQQQLKQLQELGGGEGVARKMDCAETDDGGSQRHCSAREMPSSEKSAPAPLTDAQIENIVMEILQNPAAEIDAGQDAGLGLGAGQEAGPNPTGAQHYRERLFAVDELPIWKPQSSPISK